MFIIKNDIDYSIDSKSSESGGFPATEIKDWEFQFDLWRATGTSDEWIILDLGSAKAVNGIALLNPNVPQVKLEGNDTTTFTSPSFVTSPATTTMETDPFRERYYHYFDATALDTFNYRYIRVFFPSGQATIDGDSVYSLGGVAVSDSAEDLPQIVQRGFNITPQLAGENINMLSGRSQFVQRGNRRMVWNISLIAERTEAEFEQVISNFFAIDEFTPVIMNINSEYIEHEDKKNFTYSFKRGPDITMNTDNPGFSVSDGLTLIETV